MPPFTEGYTGHHTAIWSRRGGLGAAWRWPGGTRSASSAGRLPASHSRGPDTRILYSARRTRKISVLKSKLDSSDFCLTLNVTSKPKINDSGNVSS